MRNELIFVVVVITIGVKYNVIYWHRGVSVV